MYKCSSVDGKMNPDARKCIDRFVIQSKFRQMYPDKAKVIQGMTVPSSCADSIEELVKFADEKKRNLDIKLAEEKKRREQMGAPAKFDKYGKYKY
jgi:hypothetical protein